MNGYRQTLTIDAPAAAVYAALTTKDGLRGWWTQDCDGQTHPGGVLTFRFGPHHKDMRIEQMEADREVRWRCTGAHIAFLEKKDEWDDVMQDLRAGILAPVDPEGRGRARSEPTREFARSSPEGDP